MLRNVRRVGIGAAVLAVVLLAPEGTDAIASPAPADPNAARLSVRSEKSLAGTPVTAPKGPDHTTGTPFRVAAPTWPAGSASVTLSSKATKAGALPVSVRSAGAALVKSAQPLTVDVLDRAATAATGVKGIVVRTAGPAQSAVHVDIDYSSFKGGFDGGGATSLQITQLTGCVPMTAACTMTPVPSTNNTAHSTIGADVAAGSTVALAEAPEGSTGDFSATPLKASATWEAGGSSGNFTWSYDIKAPNSLNGPIPDLGVSYSSQSVDGEVAASNSQPSWLGEGFGDMAQGAIERKYASCGKDMGGTANNKTKTGDLCWKSDNATLTLNGESMELLKGSDGKWHPRNDNGDRIELRTGATNGDHDGQWWVVTEPNGTQYWFGKNQLPGYASGKAVTNSVWTVPVYGNNPGEPCNSSSGFAASACDRGWRWNLDYVVDLNGNSMSLWYGVEKNNYAKNGSVSTIASYTRGGWLDRIDYGTRSDTAYGTAPMQVDFGEADRCDPTQGACTTHNAVIWPDTPWNYDCAKSPCSYGSPTFWTAKRLATVTTKVGGQAVDQWTFKQSFPSTGDVTRAGLFLDSITHQGLAGVAAGTRTGVTLPDVNFVGVQMPNRVDADDQAPAMKWWRLASIESENGGTVNVTYSPGECVAGTTMPDAAHLDQNGLRCFPVYWTRAGDEKDTLDFFHKYVVTDVTESDQALPSDQRSVPTVTHYDYLTVPAWRYTDDDGFVDPIDKTWGVWRGYGRVRTTEGTGTEATRSETVFFQGMDGDKTTTGTRSVSLPAAGGTPAIADRDAFAGMVREDLDYQDATGPEISATVSVPWQSDPPSATRTINGTTVDSRYIGIAEKHTRTALDGGRGWRTTTTKQTFDKYGMATLSEDDGDDAVTTDQACIQTDYARVDSATAYLIDRPSRVRKYGVDCTKAQAGGLTADDVASDIYTLYDGGGRNAAPTKGQVTETDRLVDYNASRYIVDSKMSYDTYGRIHTTTDDRGNVTTTDYTPTTGGPLTGMKTTNALGWTSTTTLDPALDLPTAVADPNGKTTRKSYDALGRVTGVWQPDRAASQTPDTTYAYQVRKSGGSSVVTGTLNADGTAYNYAVDIVDGQARPRQSQSAQGGTTVGRIVSDTFYDSAGRSSKTTTYLVTGAVDVKNVAVVAQPAEANIPAETISAYDGNGREIRSTFKSYAGEKFHTTTAYGGDRTDVTPPAGSMPTSTYVDAQGRTVRQREFHGTTVGSGDYNDLTYSFDRKGHMTQETDNAGNLWTYGFDFSGNQTSSRDPDSGQTSQVYNDFGDLLSSTNGEGKVLVFGYDSVGRKTSVRHDSATGPLDATWTYDSAVSGATTITALGQQISSTRYSNGSAYTETTTGFNDLYEPTGLTVTIPSTETGLAGTYNYKYGYTATGLPQTAQVPALGALPQERFTTAYNAHGDADTLKTNVSATGDDIFLVDGTGYTAYGELGLISRVGADGKWLDTAFDYEDGTRRLNRIHSTRATAPAEVADFRLYYDPSGNVTENQELDAGDTQCFGYDYAQRLTEAWTPSSASCGTARSQSALGGPAPYWNSYTYDAVGNRTSSTERTKTTSLSRSYTYPAPKANQPHAVQSLTTSGTGTTTTTANYSYDKDGNTVTRPANGTGGGSQTLTWNPDGTLASSTDAGGTSTYVYDADGNRLIAREPGGTTLTLPGQELKVANGQSAATRYIQHAGQTIGVRTASGLTWEIDDQQGTATVEVDAGTQGVTKRWFTPFGTVRGAAVSWVTDKGLVGGTQDASGLTHMGAREYDPTIGRFISVDPVIANDDPQQMQGYNYASASPVTQSDPDGNFSWGAGLGKAIAKAVKKVAKYIKSHVKKKRPSSGLGRAIGQAVRRVGRILLRGAIGRAAALAAIMVLAGVPAKKKVGVLDRLGGLFDGIVNSPFVSCGLSHSDVACTYVKGLAKRALNEVGRPEACTLAELATCKHSFLTILNHISLELSICYFACLDLTFQGGVLQGNLSNGGAGFGIVGSVQVHRAVVRETGNTSAEVCVTEEFGICGGLAPTTDKDGKVKPLKDWDFSGGPAVGFGAKGGIKDGLKLEKGDGDYEGSGGIQLFSWDIEHGKFQMTDWGTPAWNGLHGMCKHTWGKSLWWC
jgi:RHS repeat-associated protein